jgi:TPR repeat protein
MGNEHQNPPLSSLNTYQLSQDELIKLSKLVEEENDANAAFRLYQYYAFSNFDDNKMMHYLEIAAENGNLTAQHNLSYLYMEQNKLDKAFKWAKKAKEGGHKYSDSLLQEIERKNETNR